MKPTAEDLRVANEVVSSVSLRNGLGDLARAIASMRASEREKAERSQHPDAHEIDNLLCDCCAKYECPNCGLRFKVELPQ